MKVGAAVERFFTDYCYSGRNVDGKQRRVGKSSCADGSHSTGNDELGQRGAELKGVGGDVGNCIRY